MKLALLSPALTEILEAIEYYDDRAGGLGGALEPGVSCFSASHTW